MKLLGQDGQAGYAMAALMVAMSIAAIMMTVAMPVWKQMERREKEEELIFRGQQYIRALRLFSTKYANASPPSIDILVEQRFIRKKFKDPITNDDFQPILAGQAIPGSTTGGQPGATGGTGSTASPFGSGVGGRGATTSPQQSTIGRAGASNPSGISSIGSPGAGSTGGIMGVVSKSKDQSLRLYNGRSHYNEWAFINTPQQLAPGAGAPGSGVPGQRGGQGQGRGQGTSPFGSGIGGQRGRGANPNEPGGPGRGPGGSPFSPSTSPFQPGQSPFQPQQPGRGRGGQ